MRKFWHMQLHPDDNAFTREQVKDLAVNKKVIGMGESWPGDKGQPAHFMNDMAIGDIVVVRHHGPVCLLEVTSKCYSNADEHEVDAWFDIYRKVKVLSDKGTDMRDTFKAMGKKWVDGIYAPSTLQPADNWEFARYWYNDYKQEQEMEEMEQIKRLLEHKKNVILQGAPGTGKTYQTAAAALSILGVDYTPGNHKEIMDKYENYRRIGQISFTTFHQSFDYEDFVEGLKPSCDNKAGFIVEPGIFKKICDEARLSTPMDEKKKFDDCIDKLKKECLKEQAAGRCCECFTKEEAMFRIKYDEGKEGNFLYQPSKSEKIKDDPWYSIQVSNIYNYFRDTHSKHNLSSYSYGILKKMNLDRLPIAQKKNNYVLIIDEINRGNISKIFGELITLLENDKRKGSDHPIDAILPYSKEPFYIPSNLYIIGTMNTTDRSVGTIDYAIRRRFAFYTLAANSEAISGYYKTGQEELRDKAVNLFETIKTFVETHKTHELDIEDLMIGHSYFMAGDKETLEMKLKYEVIPLILEYNNDGLINLDMKQGKLEFDKWKNILV